jgi:hypothetical protein
MITLKEWMAVVGYRITEGSDYGWNCYGPNAYRLDSWNGEQNGHSFNIVFDTITQVVYEANAHDYANNRAYRLCNTAFIKAHDQEATERGCDINEAWEDVNYIELEVNEDWIEKAEAIISNQDYDTRVQVPLTLDKDQMYLMMQMAHEADLTLNQFVEKLLREEIVNKERIG